MTKKLAARTKNQPSVSIRVFLVSAVTDARLGVSSSPQTTKAMDRAPVTPNTTQSRPGFGSWGVTGAVIGASGWAWRGPVSADSAAPPVSSDMSGSLRHDVAGSPGGRVMPTLHVADCARVAY
jgi:hypothetical protein